MDTSRTAWGAELLVGTVGLPAVGSGLLAGIVAAEGKAVGMVPWSKLLKLLPFLLNSIFSVIFPSVLRLLPASTCRNLHLTCRWSLHGTGE